MRYPLPKPLVLIGMMGAGKTSLGMKISEHYAIPFIDSDQEIRDAAQMTITDIFQKLGENHFRNGEERVIARIFAANKKFVLASGGGAILSKQTRTLFKQKAVTLWLDVEKNILWRRVKNSKSRPLLQKKEGQNSFFALYDERCSLYSKADIRLSVGKETVDETFIMICDAIETFRAKADPTSLKVSP